MHIHLNGSDLQAIAFWREAGLIDGVTTNPAITAAGAADRQPADLLREISRIMGPQGQVFAQVLSRDPAEQLEEARFLATLGPHMVIKVLMDTVGQRSIPRMVAAGLQVAATAVNSIGRAIAAANCGAHYAIPYFGWLEDAMEAPTGLVDDIAEIHRAQGYTTRLHVLVRRIADLRAAGRAGAWGVLLDAPDLERVFFHHAQTELAVNRQHAAWRERFGDTTWLDHRGGAR